jgi:hypothetical protein
MACFVWRAIYSGPGLAAVVPARWPASACALARHIRFGCIYIPERAGPDPLPLPGSPLCDHRGVAGLPLICADGGIGG